MRHAAANDFAEWRRHARALLTQRIPPAAVTWGAPEGGDLFAGAHGGGEAAPESAAFSIPRRFLAFCETVAWHRSADKWAQLYALLWKFRHETPRILEIESDDNVRRARLMYKQVRRDLHKMHAFVRFEERAGHGGAAPVFEAWYEPDHLILAPAAKFFVRRFGNMRWRIRTPEGVAEWDLQKLRVRTGATARESAPEDPVNDLWRSYYTHVHNPARVNVKAMKQEMPARFWKNLPEARMIEEMLREGPARLREMAASAPIEREARAEVPETACTAAELRAAATGCRACTQCQGTTGTVFGEGPARAPVLIVGEQPGDEEDRAGRPFVGPAGRLLRELMAEAGFPVEQAYVTNAVKHFGFTLTGEKRIHRKPTISVVRACRPWLESEVKAVRPRVVLCLGGTAAQSLIGYALPIARALNVDFATEIAPVVRISYHPAAILRAGTPELAARMRAQLKKDLRRLKEFLRV